MRERASYHIRSKVILTILLAVIGLAFLMPLLWMISASLMNNNQIYDYPFHWLPPVPQWRNYAEIYTWPSMELPRLYKNSLVIACVSILGSIIISSLSAYAFAKIDFPGKGLVFAVFIGVMMIPSQITIIPRFLLYKELGLYNTLAAVILPALFSVTSIFLLRQSFMGLPNELSESAFLDGAGHFCILTRIVVPLSKPTLASIVIMNFITSWNDYFGPLIFLARKELYTVSLGIKFYYAQEVPSTHLTMAMSVCALLPILIIFFCCQNFFIESIAKTGVKG